MRVSQVLRLESPRNWCRALQALRKHSWVSDSAASRSVSDESREPQNAGPVDAHDFVEVGQLQHRLLSFVDGELVACDLFHATR